MAGLAEIPENPSDPPHSRPMVSLLRGAGSRVCLFASMRAIKVSVMEFLINSCSFPCILLIMYNDRLIDGRVDTVQGIGEHLHLEHSDTQDSVP